MKQQLGNRFVLIPIGLLVTSSVQILARYTAMPDFMKGVLTGFGIGLMMIPFVLKKWKRNNC